MYRIDNATALAALPMPNPVGPTVPGYFTNSGLNQTIVDGDWLNAVQEELIAVIANAGITLSKTTRTQLLQALLQMGRYQHRVVWRRVSGTLSVSIDGAAFTSVGANSFNPLYTGIGKLTIQGAGGGSGGTTGTGASGGGAAGAYAEASVSFTFGTPVAIAIGAGGTAGGSTTGDGGTGGSSTWGAGGSLITAPGGGGSVHAATGASGGGGAASSAASGTGIYFSQLGTAGANAGSTGVIGGGTLIQPGAGASTRFGQGSFAQSATPPDNFGCGAGGAVATTGNGFAGQDGVMILEY